MIITGTIVVTITVIVSAITGTAGVAGGFYWGSSKEDRKHKKALKKLKEEQQARQRELQQSTHSLVANTDSQVMAVTNNTAAIQNQIGIDTADLNKEIKVVQGANLQLLSVTDLLKLTGESVGQELQPLIKELQRRVDELTHTNQELAATKIKLNEAVQKLQYSVDKHAAIKDKLEIDIAESQKKIVGLSSKLDDAASLLLKSADAKDKKIISLEEKSAELASKLSAAVKMNQALRAENKALTQIIDLLTKAVEVHQPTEKQIESTSSAPKLRMFGT